MKKYRTEGIGIGDDQIKIINGIPYIMHIDIDLEAEGEPKSIITFVPLEPEPCEHEWFTHLNSGNTQCVKCGEMEPIQE